MNKRVKKHYFSIFHNKTYNTLGDYMNDRVAKKVVIDPGHGGTDSGTVNNGIVEKEYSLKISNYIKNRLDELGIENSMTRTTDELLDQTTRPQRAQSFYGTGSDVIVLSNHLNAGGADGSCGKLTFFEKLRKIFYKTKIKYLFCVILDISSDRLCLR